MFVLVPFSNNEQQYHGQNGLVARVSLSAGSSASTGDNLQTMREQHQTIEHVPAGSFF
jgi:hypothetical protein